MTVKKQLDNDWQSLLDKKNLSEKASFPWSKFGFLVFIVLFAWGFFSSIPVKEPSPVITPSISVINQEKDSFITPKNVFSPDLIAAYVLNYKTTQTISSTSYKDYLKQADTPIDFADFSTNKLNIQLQASDLGNGINQLKHFMIQEDLSIIPFKSGNVSIESEIIETTQSQHYYMVEVLKTFTQGKRTIKVLEKKIFNLQSLENGQVSYYKNIIFNSSESFDK